MSDPIHQRDNAQSTLVSFKFISYFNSHFYTSIVIVTHEPYAFTPRERGKYSHLTTTEWIGKISAWSESTSTSPSSFHLTHSKPLVPKHDLTPGSPEHAALEEQRKQLIQWQVDLLNAAIKHQYSFHHWQSIVNVMILKQPGNHKIHRLCVIHLYEHDYNLLLAVKWRSVIQHCVHTRKFNPGQCGGLLGHDAITPTIIEEFQYEISRASKRPLVHLDYDTTACYDRIIHPMASLISRAYGQHRSIVLINGTTLKSVRYLLKTQLGISSISYSHSKLFPIYGSRQGSGNFPGLWCAFSSVLFDVYETQACRVSFYSPDKTITVKLYMIGFVDDTSGSTNDFLLPEPAPLHHYANLATHDPQCWNNILQLSGRALKDSKCSYHFMHYGFTRTGQPVLKGGTFDPAILNRFNNNTTPTSLKQLSAYTSHKTLGVYKNPDGNTTAAFRVLKEKNTIRTKTASHSPLTHMDNWAYYHAIYLPNIVYPFPSGSLQCH